MIEPAPPLAVSVPAFRIEAEPRSMSARRREAVPLKMRLLTDREPPAPLPACSVAPEASVVVPWSEPVPASVAPEATVVATFAPARPPRTNLPALTLRATVPVSVLAEPRVKVPEPVLVTLPVPAAVPSTLPLKEVLAPTVRAPELPRRTEPPVAPAPSRASTVWAVSLRSRVAPATLAKLMTVLGEIAPATPARRVPASIEVATE